MQFVDVSFTLTDFWRYNSKYSILGDHRVQISWNYELCIFAVTFLDMHETRDSVHVQSPQWSFGDRCPVCSWCPAQVHCSPPGLSCTLSGSGRGSGGQLLGLPASSGAAWSGPQRSSWLGPPLASYGSGFHNLEDVNKEWVLEVFCILIKDQQWFHYELSGIMVTLGHEEGDSESTLCNSLSECRQAGSIEWKRAADQNIQHNTKALCRKQWASAVCPNVNAYSLNQANFIFLAYPNVQLRTLILFPFKHFRGSIRRAATPRWQRLSCIVEVSKSEICKKWIHSDFVVQTCLFSLRSSKKGSGQWNADTVWCLIPPQSLM